MKIQKEERFTIAVSDRNEVAVCVQDAWHPSWSELNLSVKLFVCVTLVFCYNTGSVTNNIH